MGTAQMPVAHEIVQKRPFPEDPGLATCSHSPLESLD